MKVTIDVSELSDLIISEGLEEISGLTREDLLLAVINVLGSSDYEFNLETCVDVYLQVILTFTVGSIEEGILRLKLTPLIETIAAQLFTFIKSNELKSYALLPVPNSHHYLIELDV